MEYKSKPKGRAPRKVVRRKVAARYPMVRIAPTKPSITTRVTPFKDQLRCHMTYYEINSVSTGAVTAGSYVYSANGLYDPNITGAGHQAMGFDQLMVMYDHYTVTGAKITVNVSNDTGLPIVFAIQVSDSPTPLTVPGQIVENGILTYGTTTSSMQGKTQFIATVGIEKFMGRPGILSEDDFRGSVAANPVEQVYFILYAWNINSVNLNPLAIDVLIEYSVVLTEPKRLTQS